MGRNIKFGYPALLPSREARLSCLTPQFCCIAPYSSKLACSPPSLNDDSPHLLWVTLNPQDGFPQCIKQQEHRFRLHVILLNQQETSPS